MSNKMEQSLDDILKASKTSRRGRGPRRSTGGPAAAAPVGGVAKSTRQGKQNKPVPTAPAATLGGETKMMVSNLPQDIDQGQLQDYFSSINAGRPKKVLLQYGPNGKSLGSAMIIFNKHEQAAKASAALDGVKIDGRPLRVEMLVSASALPATTGRPSSLADRVTQPRKDKPKPATAEKVAAGAAGGRGQPRRGRGGRGGREPRPKKKTVEELDAEMADYFPGGEANNANITSGADVAQATTAGGDTAMDDEML